MYTMSRYLSEYLICGIFERLPPKSIIRFRCLSKSWYSHFASPYFIRKHYLRSCSRKVLIRYCNIDDDKYDDDSDDDDDDYDDDDLYDLRSEDRFRFPLLCDRPTLKFPCKDHPKIVNSCNGILCLHDYKNSNRISLWNPSIRRNLTLTLADQPPCVKETHVVVGFGLDQVTNDYKIARISYFKFKGIIESTLVYSMKTRAWSSISPSPVADPPFGIVKSGVCFFNGVLHWVAECFLPHEFVSYIMTFNLSTHVFGKIKLPEPNWISRKPTVINGCLAVVSYEREYIGSVWVMEEYNNVASWYVLFKVETHPLDGVMKSVMQLPDGYFLVNYCRGGLEVHNPATGVRFLLFGTKLNKVYMETCLQTLELLDIGQV